MLTLKSVIWNICLFRGLILQLLTKGFVNEKASQIGSAKILICYFAFIFIITLNISNIISFFLLQSLNCIIALALFYPWIQFHCLTVRVFIISLWLWEWQRLYYCACFILSMDSIPLLNRSSVYYIAFIMGTTKLTTRSMPGKVRKNRI